MMGESRSDSAGTVGLGVLTAAVIAIWAVVLSSGPQAVPGGTAGGYGLPAAPRATTLATIGDSYTGGSAMGGNGAAGYPALLARQLGWRVVNTAVGGTGYVYGGDHGAPFRTQVPEAVRSAADVVLVVGGRNDVGAPAAEVEAAASELYGLLHAGLPAARIIVIGVIWTDAVPPPAVQATNDAVRRAAISSRLPFVDALSEAWLNPSLIGPDGVHPTDGGHQVLAERVREALVALGVADA